MAGFFSAFGDETGMVPFAFAFTAFAVYATGGSYSNSIFFGWAGLITAIPAFLAMALGSALGPLSLPFLLVGLMAVYVMESRLLGPIAILSFCGFVVLLLGA